MDKEEGKEIWANFENYCSYDNLKDLYQKVIPEMQKFETQMEQMSQGFE